MIYFIRDGDAVKIGHAFDPKGRVKTLRTGNSRPIVILGVMDGGPSEERDLHVRFREESIRGEWFKLSQRIIQFVETHCRPAIEDRAPVTKVGRIAPRRPASISQENMQKLHDWIGDCLMFGEWELVHRLNINHIMWARGLGVQALAWSTIGRALPQLGYQKGVTAKRETVYFGIELKAVK